MAVVEERRACFIRVSDKVIRLINPHHFFSITIIQSQNVYWTQWQPSPAFIFPSKIFIEGRSHDSPEPDTFDSEVRSDFRSAEDDEDALNSPFDSRSESNLPIRKTFAAPRFDVSVKNGKRFQIRVIHSEEKPEKSQEQMPVPPVFPKNWRKSDRFPQPPPFSLVDSDLVNQENDELENPESDSEGLFRVPTTTTPISVAPSVLLAETERGKVKTLVTIFNLKDISGPVLVGN